jgi:hypothetical protein
MLEQGQHPREVSELVGWLRGVPGAVCCCVGPPVGTAGKIPLEGLSQHAQWGAAGVLRYGPQRAAFVLLMGPFQPASLRLASQQPCPARVLPRCARAPVPVPLPPLSSLSPARRPASCMLRRGSTSAPRASSSPAASLGCWMQRWPTPAALSSG